MGPPPPHFATFFVPLFFQVSTSPNFIFVLQFVSQVLFLHLFAQHFAHLNFKFWLNAKIAHRPLHRWFIFGLKVLQEVTFYSSSRTRCLLGQCLRCWRRPWLVQRALHHRPKLGSRDFVCVSGWRGLCPVRCHSRWSPGRPNFYWAEGWPLSHFQCPHCKRAIAQ